jgi:hypothetical protein
LYRSTLTGTGTPVGITAVHRRDRSQDLNTGLTCHHAPGDRQNSTFK